jgi:hypothetical protein
MPLIYMQQPPGYVVEGHEKHVLRLKKTLYGLKQSGRRWYEKLQGVLSEFEMKRCEVDHAVFVRHYDDGGIVVIVVHVDDLTVVACSVKLMAQIKQHLSTYLEITELGESTGSSALKSIGIVTHTHSITLNVRTLIQPFVVSDFRFPCPWITTHVYRRISPLQPLSSIQPCVTYLIVKL